MPQTLYALLVGIDTYPSPVRPLSGCVNDIASMESLVAERMVRTGARVELLVLKNEQATRQAIIDGFLIHLGKAGPEDVALFCYSGHGSQQATPPEFWHLEPDRLDETLVCYDSRLPGQYDLADKELSKLIAEVAKRDAHVVVILDSCHSGSGTRNFDAATVRRVPTDPRIRPASSFLVTPAESQVMMQTRSATEAPSGWMRLPRGKHVVLSACQADEEAQEVRVDGSLRGVFSHFLHQTLQRANATPTYRDLFKRVDALVRTLVARQSPLIEATDLADLDRPFLGGAIVPSPPYFTLSWDKRDGWVIDAGSMHGIPSPKGEETAWLAVFPFDATSMADSSAAIGEARVQKTQPGRSVVELSMMDGKPPDTALTFKAVVTALPVSPLEFTLEGEADFAARVRNALATASATGTPSLFVRESSDSPQLRVIAGAEAFRIMRVADDRRLVVDVAGSTDAAAHQVVERLEHIARWSQIAALANPATKLAPNSVRLDLHAVGSDGTLTPLQPAISGSGLRLQYQLRDGEWHEPQFKIELTNMSGRRLYCMLLDLTETYKVWPGLLPGGGIWLGPGERTWAFNGDAIFASVPDVLWRQGLTEIKDLIKLIVSTEVSDATLFEQDELDTKFQTRSAITRGGTRPNSLERLMRRVQTRDFQARPQALEPIADWVTAEIGVTTVRPQESIPVPAAGNALAMTPQVSLLGHAALRATARLTTVPLASRDADMPLLPALFRDDPSVAQPFELSASRGGDAGMSVLELADINDYTVVTPEQPLVIRVDASLRASEHVVPLGYDGEFYLPLGRARSVDGTVEVTLDRLPRPINTRSLRSAVRILFEKIVAERFGLEYRYPLLAAVDAERQRITDPKELRAKVAAAGRIVLYVHGIIGDTLGMAASAYVRIPVAEAPLPVLSERYDLVLTFDYENLKTPIDETARDLKQRLAQVGLSRGHGKTLHIVAHSMGGLVSRWFIEREGGKEIVQRLVMLGTPNGGSPWSAIQDWATMVLALGLNGLTAIAWPAKLLGGLVAAIERIDVTLDQMAPDSPFLKSLAASPDPKVGYAILAGNTSIIRAAPDGEADGRVQRLLTALSGNQLLHRATALAFFGQPNDIAASVRSIGGLPQSWSGNVKVHEVPADHISYFSTEASLRALAAALASP